MTKYISKEMNDKGYNTENDKEEQINNLSEKENKNNLNNLLTLTSKGSYNNPPRKMNNYIKYNRKNKKRKTAKNPITISVLDMGHLNNNRNINRNNTTIRRKTYIIGNNGNLILQNINTYIDSNNYHKTVINHS